MGSLHTQLLSSSSAAAVGSKDKEHTSFAPGELLRVSVGGAAGLPQQGDEGGCKTVHFCDQVSSQMESDAFVVSGIVAGLHSRIQSTLRDSAPPPHILEQLSVRVDGILKLHSTTYGKDSGSKTGNDESDASTPYVRPKAIKINHILVDSEDYCLDVKKMAQDGKEPFDSLARRHSRCGSGLQTGGALGEVILGGGQFDATFEEAAFAAPPGVVTGPIRTSHGYHLILVRLQ